MTNSGQDVHSAIGEVIIAYREEIDSPYLTAIHAIRSMLHADPFASTDTTNHAFNVYAYAIKMLMSESDYSDERSTATMRAQNAINGHIGNVASIQPTDPWANVGDENA